MTTIFAHRGFHLTEPENSMAAFAAAIKMKAEGIETDVHLTKDQVPVIMHDESLKRMTGDPRYVNDLTLSQLKELHLENSSEQIPTLFEFLSYLKEVDYPGILNLEIKTDKIHYPEIEEITLKVIQQVNVDCRVIFSSFYAPTLIKLHSMGNFECAYLFKFSDREALKLLQAGVVQSLHPRYHYALRDQAFPVRAWTINRPLQMSKCFAKGLAGIFTDELELAFQIRDNKKVI
ncbi:glycerophosphodiester phosphodiesterase family protein [Xylocopilactobacillus apicola]|uniref:Glycerophosphoryl diester phosphodiesterase n=1 Tax=Xylocopilactobacillus apicola TaxID=2932184 RepID=A0AAU9DW67_9LACO|nr:glycerophosphodiester phosphodiesterase family protein [Xylocopilactobacillus apicola]BDR58203.1 glycerophosphoryl diester phosphodiesterase [Xylocopilactobacillus apicola]